MTGRESWTADDELPRDFFEKLHAATGCDAVLFVELTRFQPYPPLQIGWKARLVDCYEGQTWWAFDGVFDAGSTRVLAGAKAYARSHLNLPNVLLDGASVISSPGRFGQYTAHITARTLPDGPLFAKASWDIADRSEK